MRVLGLVLMLGLLGVGNARAATYEAESTDSVDCTVESWTPGYSGGGYLVCGSRDSSVAWTVEAPSDGDYTVLMRYGSRDNQAKPTELTVNQKKTATVSFPPTNSCIDWSEASAVVRLDAGYNQLMLVSQTPKGMPNLDAIDVEFIQPPPPPPAGWCGIASENQTLGLACPSGIISSISFASYGLPAGSCEQGFATAECHAAGSVETVERACLGLAACDVPASNGLFGDPCVGRPKRLAVQYECSDASSNTGLSATYYDNIDFTGTEIKRTDTTIDFDWGRGAPIEGMGADTFSIRWTGFITAPSNGQYTFYTVSDDGVRLIVDGKTLIENWTNHPPTENSARVQLHEGQAYPLTLEYFERGGGAVIRLYWEGPGFDRAVVPVDVLSQDGSTPPPMLPVKVFVLAGQSNMVGFGTVSNTPALLERNGGLGTLETLVTNPETASTFQHLGTPGNWSTRDDVWVVGLDSSGPLGIGFDGRDLYGPELQFGHVVGDYYEEPVLLIKIAWGGKDLYRDFRPPSSGGETGPYYVEMVTRVKQILGNLDEFMPGYAGQGYELAGFGWHQGWNDRVNQVANDEYQVNCVNLINDLREEFGVPTMPFVLATTGMSGWNETHPRALSLMAAQLAVPTDPGLAYRAVRAVDTRDYWRDETVSPSNQGYHWNRNAETYFLIGDGMGDAMVDLVANGENPCGDFCEVDVNLDHVFVAQTHVLPIDNGVMKLTGSRAALIKAQVTATESILSPPVTATLTLGGRSMTLPLTGPSTLPIGFVSELGKVQHSMLDSFVGTVPADWVEPGLHVSITAADETRAYDVAVGAPTRVIMSMFDVHYFKLSPGDYPDGWREEIEAKWPVAELEVRRVPNIVFPELVIPPRAGVAAARVTSREDYKEQTGLNFDGEQAAALQWKSALKAAAGTAGRWSLYYVNIYGVHAGGQAGGFGGVGNGKAEGVLHHELGHALSLPHWGTNASYPYKGDMYGIAAPVAGEPHVGPVWGFDLARQTFFPPTVQPNSVGGTVGTYKRDPMWGGGRGDQEQGFLLRHFSDYSVAQMQRYLESHVVEWNETLDSWATWNQTDAAYTAARSNDGVQFPVERDVDVVSVMVSVSGAKPDINFVYPPIGPYRAGLIRLFDPTVAKDRNDASIYCPRDGCDLTLRIVQGGRTSYYMVPAEWQPDVDPLNGQSLRTRAINLPADAGSVTEAELLLTPDVQVDGMPANPFSLYVWNI